jgi:[phosphatase 2A protein]-leucine-carboxy methyltransferase
MIHCTPTNLSFDSGTYVRTTAIDRLVSRFLDESDGTKPPRKKQIISLGAGSDTRAFRLFASRPSLSIVYHELDFPVNTAAKIKAIQASPLLRKTLGVTDDGESETIISATGDAFHSQSYHIHPMDLRTLVLPRPQATNEEAFSSTTDIKDILPGIEDHLPTLLLSECCLIYLPPEEAIGVLEFFTNHLLHKSSSDSTPFGLVLYEPIRPDDPFGKTMVSNLATRGIQLQTLHRYASLAAQKQRLNDHGFHSGQGAADIDFIWQHWVSEVEKERVAALEMLDEIEEWRLLAQHYCVAWGWSQNDGNENMRVFDGWKRIENQLGPYDVQSQ